MYKENPFIFSDKYRLLRHLVFWLVHALIFTYIYGFGSPSQNFGLHFIMSVLWVLPVIIYTYPIMYLFIPAYLLKERYKQFVLIMILWGIAGWFWNYVCRTYYYYPLADTLHFKTGNKNPWAVNSFLTMNAMAGYASMIVLFKYWIKKQRDWLKAEKEKATAELQLLKAQIHPHFLFNTLNNIYSFSLKGSLKTSDMIAKLSSLLGYMLYDCKNNEVLLEKEIEVMKSYIGLEKERYGNKLEISINIEGDVTGKFISPLLLLPFIENAFKHGTSEQLEKPWLSIDVSVKQNILRCKILNSKNESSLAEQKGIGIENVKKRLAYLYPKKHDLKISNEGNFFVVSLMLQLEPGLSIPNKPTPDSLMSIENISV